MFKGISDMDNSSKETKFGSRNKKKFFITILLSKGLLMMCNYGQI